RLFSTGPTSAPLQSRKRPLPPTRTMISSARSMRPKMVSMEWYPPSSRARIFRRRLIFACVEIRTSGIRRAALDVADVQTHAERVNEAQHSNGNVCHGMIRDGPRSRDVLVDA